MTLSGISLKNFRTHKNTILKFSDTLNYIVGGNGQGKTSVLEAIYYMCTTKSFNSKDTDVVNFETDEFEITGNIKDLTSDNIRIVFSEPENRKYYFLNEKIISKSSHVIGKFPVVILTPADHSITQGSPSDRRKFVDSVISQASSTYLSLLLDYNKTLKQRAAILNRLRENFSKENSEELNAWTEKLITDGSQIIEHRVSFLDSFREYLNSSYYQIIESSEIPTVEYVFLKNNVNNISVDFRNLVNEKRDEEIKRGINLTGPHRDEFIFAINGFNLKTYGSQGQHKTFQTALRFAEFFYLKDATLKTPIFLLDDVFGELDAHRAGKISRFLTKVGQAFITLTDFADFSFLSKNENDIIVRLNNGKVLYA